MSNDIEKHHELLRALKDTQGKGDGSFEQAVTKRVRARLRPLGAPQRDQ